MRKIEIMFTKGVAPSESYVRQKRVGVVIHLDLKVVSFYCDQVRKQNYPYFFGVSRRT